MLQPNYFDKPKLEVKLKAENLDVGAMLDVAKKL